MATSCEIVAFKNISEEVNISKDKIVFLRVSCKGKKIIINKYSLLYNQILKEIAGLEENILCISYKNQCLHEGINSLQNIISSAKANNNRLKKTLISSKNTNEKMKVSCETIVEKYKKKWEESLENYESTPLAVERRKLKKMLAVYEFQIKTYQNDHSNLIQSFDLIKHQEKMQIQSQVIKFAQYMVDRNKKKIKINELLYNTDQLKKECIQLEREKNEIHHKVEALKNDSSSVTNKTRLKIEKRDSFFKLPSLKSNVTGLTAFPVLQLPLLSKSAADFSNVGSSDEKELFKKPLMNYKPSGNLKNKKNSSNNNSINTEALIETIISPQINEKVSQEIQSDITDNIENVRNAECLMECGDNKQLDKKIKIINDVQLNPEETCKILQKLIDEDKNKHAKNVTSNEPMVHSSSIFKKLKLEISLDKLNSCPEKKNITPMNLCANSKELDFVNKNQAINNLAIHAPEKVHIAPSSGIKMGSDKQVMMEDIHKEMLNQLPMVKSPNFQYGPKKNLLVKKIESNNISRSLYFKNDCGQPKVETKSNASELNIPKSILPETVHKDVDDSASMSYVKSTVMSAPPIILEQAEIEIDKPTDIENNLNADSKKVTEKGDIPFISKELKVNPVPENITSQKFSTAAGDNLLNKKHGSKFSSSYFAKKVENFEMSDDMWTLSSGYEDYLETDYPKYVEKSLSQKSDHIGTKSVSNDFNEAAASSERTTNGPLFSLFDKESKPGSQALKEDDPIKNDPFNFFHKPPVNKINTKSFSFNFKN